MKTFSQQDMKNLAYEEWEGEDWEIIEDKIEEQRRWMTFHSIIFRYKDKFYSTYWDTPSTESSGEFEPFEYEKSGVECEEMKQVEVLTKVWTRVDS